MTPRYITYSNIIIDDIVLWDGRTFMGTLGGSGTHALVGMRVWSDQLGFVASVGPDFDFTHRAQLERMNIDLRGVIERDNSYKTARAWQLFEPDERRIEIMRTELEDFYNYTPQYEEIPADYNQVRCVHIQWGRTYTEVLELMNRFREANSEVCIMWEPVYEHLNGTSEEYRPIMEQIALISPDREEARSMTRQTDLEDAIKTLLDWGVPIVAVRMGADGSLVRTATGEGWRIPAVPAEVVDVTGAGDAYCGGFMVGLGEGLSTVEAALRATVSASFALGQFGVPDFDEKTDEEAERRLAWAREQVESL